MKKPLIDVIVNKSWEVEPFMEGLLKTKLLGEPYALQDNEDKSDYIAPFRAEYHLDKIDVLIRCIQDMMDDPTKGKSNSEEKYRVLPGYIKADQPDLIVSVSTAESTEEFQDMNGGSHNGSVAVGGDFFMYDGGQFDPTSESHLTVSQSTYANNTIDLVYNLFNEIPDNVKDEFLTPPHMPANPMQVVANPSFVSVGVVNIENYKCYAQGDPAAYEAFMQSTLQGDIPVCIETTHGIVRMSENGNIATVFVSPIVDRYEKFAEDVNDEQNRCAGYNAGVAVAHFLKLLNEQTQPDAFLK